MKSFLRILLFLFASCLAHGQTTLFQNISVAGTETVQASGNLTLLSGSAFTFGISGTTNSLLYITNAGGNVGTLGLGAGLSVSGGNLVAGSSTSANPSAKVGPSTVNGSAATFMRSDAAPAIDLTATYPWTGIHSFAPTAVQTNPVREYGVQVIPTLNQRNNALFSLIYGNETVTQAGSGQQDLEELAVGGTDKWQVDSTGSLITGLWKGSVIGSTFGGTGTGSFAEGTTLTANAANTWTALAPGAVNTLYTSGGTGALTSWQLLSVVMDTLGTPAQGDVLYRNATAWVFLAPGTSGQVLSSGGAAANPSWVNASTPPGTTVAHDVATYSNTVGGLEDTQIANITSSIFNISTSTGSNNGALFVNNTNSAGQVVLANLIGANVSTGAGNEDAIYFGQNESTANEAYIGFSYVGGGSASNYFAVGFYGKADVLKIPYTGTATFASSGNNFTATTSASSATTGAVTIGNGTAATNVGIGGGNVNAGGTITSGGAMTANTLVVTGKATSYNGIATAGWGVPAIQGYGRVVGAVAAQASVATYAVSSDGTFLVSANVNVTTATLHNFTVTCTYTDEGNVSRTLTMGFTQLAGATLLSNITNATGAGPYEGIAYHIRAKGSTNITIATVGTFTTVTYNCEGLITETD